MVRIYNSEYSLYGQESRAEQDRQANRRAPFFGAPINHRLIFSKGMPISIAEGAGSLPSLVSRGKTDAKGGWVFSVDFRALVLLVIVDAGQSPLRQ